MNLTQWLQIGITSFVIPAVMGSGCLATLTGCAFIKPTTAVSVNPITRTISFTDTKDNDIEISGVSWADGTDGKSFKLESITVSNRSSPVIAANVEQMKAFALQQQAANQGIRDALSGLATTIGAMGGAITALGQAIPTIQGTVGQRGGEFRIERGHPDGSGPGEMLPDPPADPSSLGVEDRPGPGP